MSSAIEIDERYKQGKIYKLVDRTNGNIYIGSTINTLNYRLRGHKKSYKIHKKGKCKSTTSFEIIENNNYYIELIEDYPCNNRYELEQRERFHIEHNICLNKYIPTRKKKEWYEDNKEDILLKIKEYREDNKAKIALKKKEYYQKKKAEIDLQHKEYYQKIKDELNEKRKVKILCEICNSFCRKSDFYKHKKTQKHIINMNK